MIQAIDITKSFGDKILFDKLNFTIQKGEFVCFSGPSGAGKTTLLNIIGAIENYDKGQLLVDGQELNTKKKKMEYYKTKVGFLFQNFALVDNKTVEANLNFVKKKNRTAYTLQQVLQKVGLEDKLYSKVYTLSGGEQQRVALARLFLKKCEIVLADEPTGSLDKANAEKVMKLLFEINKEGKTVILVTHDEEIKKMVGRIIEI